MFHHALLCITDFFLHNEPSVQSSTGISLNQIKSYTPFAVTEHTPDFIHLYADEKKSKISIEQVRELIASLQQQPLKSTHTIALLSQAHLLSIEAQQALLKTLEEPPKHAQIILCAPSTTAVLPTILSRCSYIFLTDDTTQPTQPNSENLDTLPNTITEILRYTDTFSNTMEGREKAITLLTQIINSEKQKLEKTPTKQKTNELKYLLLAHKQLQANVHVKLVLEHLCFSIRNTK